MKGMVFNQYRGELLWSSTRISKRTIKIGSHAQADLRVDDLTVGRVHAVVETDSDGNVWIVNHHHRGTFVNGVRTNKSQLQHADKIKIGDVEIVMLAQEVETISSYAEDSHSDEVRECDEFETGEFETGEFETSLDLLGEIAAKEIAMFAQYKWAERCLAGHEGVVHSPIFEELAGASLSIFEESAEWLALYEGGLKTDCFGSNPSATLYSEYADCLEAETEIMDLFLDLESYAREEERSGLADWASRMLVDATRRVLVVRKIVVTK